MKNFEIQINENFEKRRRGYGNEENQNWKIRKEKRGKLKCGKPLVFKGVYFKIIDTS